MEGSLIVIGLVVGVFLAVAPVLAWVSIFQIQGVARRLSALEQRFVALERALRYPPPAARAAAAEPAEPPQTGEIAPQAQATPPRDLPAEAGPGAEVPPEALPPEEEQPERIEEPARPVAVPIVARQAGAVPPAAAEATPTPRSRAEGVEQALTSQWMVWLGAVAVGLSAVFLFSYAVEQGWLGPLPRVVLGLILGVALLAGGEWTHRHPIPGLDRAISPDYVPPALTASGLFALYASLYAAHGVFGLIGIAPAFAALGGVGFAGLLLAVRQGWFVALLGLAGGYAMPLLLESSAPAPVPVFLYVFMLTLGCLALMVFRKWPFLAVATLAGSAGWPLLWFAGPWTVADQGVLSLYALATAAGFALLSVGFPVKQPDTPATRWLGGMIADTSGMGFVAQGALLVVLAALCDFNEAAFLILGFYAAFGMVMGLRRAAYESLGVASALIAVVAFFLWPQPMPPTIPEDIARHGVENWGDTFGPIAMPAEFRIFARAALGFAALYGVGGFLALRRAATPAVWATLSAGVPLYLFTLAYWRVGGFALNVDWGMLGAGLALAQLAAAAGCGRIAGPDRRDEPLSLYAAGCTAALALAFACVMRDAWLTVALSAEVLALAWIWTRLPVVHLRTIAYAMAGTVVVRLVLNPQIVGYGGGIGELFSWVVYGYGLPAAAFLLAARRFGDPGRDPLAALCEAAGLAFAVLTVTLQLRAWTAGGLWLPHYDLFDQAVQSVWWLLAALVLLRREVTARSPVARYGGWILLGMAAFQIGLGHLMSANPLLARQPVGHLPLVNLLGLAYVVPAVLFAVHAGSRGTDLPGVVRRWLWGGAGVLVFAWISLEVRRAFWGSEMHLGWDRPASDAEIYAYSAAWIVYALLLLGLGILRGSGVLRYASLTVLMVAVVKVFLYDMADLTGLYRVVSFLGLGLVLIGIGYVYRRLVFRPPTEPETDATT